MKIKFEIETGNGKKLSLSDMKEKAKNFVKDIKDDSNVQKAQEKVKGFAVSAAAFTDNVINNAIDKVEDYIDQKLADEKDAGPDDITEDFFESDDEEDSCEENGARIFVEEAEDGTSMIIIELDEDFVNSFDDDDFQPDGIILICDSDINEEPISFEEFLDEIVDFEESDEEPDISNETECFLEAIEYFVSEVSRKAFKVAVELPKITYETVIEAIKEDFPEMSKNEIKKLLKVDFDNWVNVRYPDIKEDCCGNANCIMLMKYWAKKFKEF